jgi:hypothetical protein
MVENCFLKIMGKEIKSEEKTLKGISLIILGLTYLIYAQVIMISDLRS